jgi:type IV pilus assembly protein PilY1
MKKLWNNRAVLAGAMLSLVTNMNAVADDIEIYVGGNLTATAVPPNILFVVDTSGSMSSLVVTQGNYDPATDYSGLPTSCAEYTNNKIYWSTGSVSTSCTSTSWFDTSYMHCNAGVNSLANTGFFQDRMARYSSNSWRTLTTSSTYKQRNVECEADSGVHGHNVNGGLYAQDNSGSNTNGGWTSNPADEINWVGERNYTIYSANFMNYLRSDPNAVTTRLKIVQDVVSDVVNSTNGINIGLMRFSQNREGGQVSYAMEDIDTARAGFIAALNTYTPSGGTPLTEVLWEAMRYYRGDPVDYGVGSTPVPSVASSQDGAGNYISPIDFQCQRNSVILLTDGAANGDNGRDNALQAMPNYLTATGVSNCPHPAEHISADGDANDGQCLDQMATYMANEDQLPAGMIDNQFVQTYTIGFQLDHPLLNSTAIEGKGLYFTADDTVGLTNAFTAIINEVLASNSTFTSPAVSVNAFSQTLHRNELYFTLFRPDGGPHWDGNLKKYRLDFDVDTNGDSYPVIEDRNGTPAIDTFTGFFRNTAHSYWSPAVDGDDVSLGGTASVLTNTRKVYTLHVHRQHGTVQRGADGFRQCRPRVQCFDHRADAGHGGRRYQSFAQRHPAVDARCRCRWRLWCNR